METQALHFAKLKYYFFTFEFPRTDLPSSYFYTSFCAFTTGVPYSKCFLMISTIVLRIDTKIYFIVIDVFRKNIERVTGNVNMFLIL